MMRISAFFGLLAVVAACGATPEPGQNGTCVLECGSPVVAPTNMIIERLDPDIEFTIFCGNMSSPAEAVGSPVSVRFRAYTTLPGGDGGASDILPVGGVGFEPWLVSAGALDLEATNPEFKTPDRTAASPPKFLGIETPSSEWCSDTCGVMQYEFRPLCVRDITNDFQAGVAAGSVKMDGFINITTDGTQSGDGG